MWSLGSLWLIINSVDDSKSLDDEDMKELKLMAKAQDQNKISGITQTKTKTKYLV